MQYFGSESGNRLFCYDRTLEQYLCHVLQNNLLNTISLFSIALQFSFERETWFQLHYKFSYITIIKQEPCKNTPRARLYKARLVLIQG